MSLISFAEAVVANLGTIPDCQKSAYFLANPQYPTLQVVPGPTQYDQAMHRALDLTTLTIQARVAWNNDVGSQKNLYRFLEPVGEDSVKAAVESDKTLGGLCDDLHVTEASGVQLMVPSTGSAELIVEWTVVIYGTGAA